MVGAGCTAIQAATQWDMLVLWDQTCTVLGVVSVLGMVPAAVVTGVLAPRAAVCRTVVVALLAAMALGLAVGAGCSRAPTPIVVAFVLCAVFDAAVACGVVMWAAAVGGARASTGTYRPLQCDGGMHARV
jgi:hypothetical protein